MSQSKKQQEPSPSRQMEQALSGLVRAADNQGTDDIKDAISLTSFGLRCHLDGNGNHGFMDLAMPNAQLTIIRGSFTLAGVQKTLATADRDCLRIRLGLSGELKVRDDSGEEMQVHSARCLLAAQTQGHEFYYENQALSPYRQINLILLRGTLSEHWGFDVANLPEPLRSFETGQLKSVALQQLAMSPAMLAIATDILECDYSGVLLDQYLEAKARESLCLLIAALQEPAADKSSSAPTSKTEQLKLSDRDRKQLQKAREIVQQSFATPPHLDELANMLGLNRNKLCTGFQLEYGLSIHEFARELRLQRALELLRQGGISITEVALEVGYQHSSSLTAAVKKRFGISPSQLKA